MPLVSVIVPVYNAEKYLDECISSILKQSLNDLEVIVVDDGSTDQSFNIAKKWSSLDQRLKLVSQQNCGVTSARQQGVRVSSGRWIIFVDADDLLPENALSLLINSSNGCEIVVGQVQYKGPGKWRFKLEKGEFDSLTYLRMMLEDILHSGPWARLIKRSLFEESEIFAIPSSITHGEDSIMNYRLAQKCRYVATIPDIVYTYIIHSTSVTKKNKFTSISYCRLFEKYAWSSFSIEVKKKIFFLFVRVCLKRRKLWLKMNVKAFLKGNVT